MPQWLDNLWARKPKSTVSSQEPEERLINILEGEKKRTKESTQLARELRRIEVELTRVRK